MTIYTENIRFSSWRYIILVSEITLLFTTWKGSVFLLLHFFLWRLKGLFMLVWQIEETRTAHLSNDQQQENHCDVCSGVLRLQMLPPVIQTTKHQEKNMTSFPTSFHVIVTHYQNSLNINVWCYIYACCWFLYAISKTDIHSTEVVKITAPRVIL